jgi:hypothetical protein
MGMSPILERLKVPLFLSKLKAPRVNLADCRADFFLNGSLAGDGVEPVLLRRIQGSPGLLKRLGVYFPEPRGFTLEPS